MTNTTTSWTIIKASAGSGKTFRLTELLTERLSACRGGSTGNGVHPSQIIATTFTRAAAAELTERIRGTLVERGLLDQAAALPTALIGTVNSVTGRILADFALDAGRSPELSVLTEQSQKTAFTLATDHIIAAAEDSHRDLLTRTNYDAIEDRGFFQQSTNWASTIRAVTDMARANNIPADMLEQFAEASISEFHEAISPLAPSEPASIPSSNSGTDTRRALANAAQTLPQQLRDDVATGKISTRSANGVLDRLDSLERFARRTRQEPSVIPWSDWIRAATGSVPGVHSPTKPIKEAYSSAVTADEILTDPALLQDLDDLIRLVFTTAAQCLGAYAEYKESLGLIDFTDQEQLTLQLLRGEGIDQAAHEAIRNTLSARYRILVVDEFQDTSPLQLALFTELASLVDEVIWVGDPKQSIYGFRGSDPALMDSAVAAVTDPTGFSGHSEVLSHSYRTRQAPLDLSNRIFSRLFRSSTNTSTSTDDIVLTIPDSRAQTYALDGDHALGETVTWPHSAGRATKAQWFERIINGITEMRISGAYSTDTAILLRTNNHAAELCDALREAGIACTGGGVPLAETREGQLVAAGLSSLIDPGDTQAIIELISLTPEHPVHSTWFTELTAQPDRDACREKIKEWGSDSIFAPLAALRRLQSALPVAELVSAVVDALDLRGEVAASNDPVERTGAVTGILRTATAYATEQESAGLPATAAGVLSQLLDPSSVSAPTLEKGAVQVLNIHQAKGLEWDTVVVALPDARERFTPSGVWVESTTSLSMEDPLAGRQIRFWPDTLVGHPEVKTLLLSTEQQKKRRSSDILEEQRLLYVAMTRSKFRTVLAPFSSASRWKALVDADIDAEELETLMRDSSPDLPPLAPVPSVSANPPAPIVTPASVLDKSRTYPALQRDFLPATFAPNAAQITESNEAPNEDDAAKIFTIHEVADLGPALVTGGGPQWNLVGDCIHSYLALPLDSLDNETKLSIATRLVNSWGVGAQISADVVVESGERWNRYLCTTLQASRVRSEVPFTWTNSEFQRAQGWIDQLATVTADDGSESLVIIDHKSYPGTDPVSHVRANYLGQMAVYRQAITDATDMTPTAVLIHLPLLGSVLEVGWS